MAVMVQNAEWSTLEILALVSAVAKKGEINWPSISRKIKPYVTPYKNIELFSDKNCALKYDSLLEAVSELEAGETATEHVLKQATQARITELKGMIKKLHANCTQLHVELNEVNSGKYSNHLELAWEEVQKRKQTPEFHNLDKLVAAALVDKKAVKDKIKEEVLDEGHSSPTSIKSDKSSVQHIKSEPGTSSPAHSTPPRLMSPSPNRSRPAVSPRIQQATRIVTTKNKLPDDKGKVKQIKPLKKKPIVPKIKIKALQMPVIIDTKGVVKGDKKESKITDVFHFDYQPPSGTGSNPNAQYSSLYQDPKLASFEGVSSSPNSVISSQSPREHHPDTDSATYRSWKKGVLFLWKRASQHKYANIFMHPVTDELAPGYSATVKRPMDLTTIRKRIDNNQICTTAQFHRDILLMFHNALMYNNASHSVYSITISIMSDIMEVIQEFYNTHNQILERNVARSRTSSLASQ